MLVGFLFLIFAGCTPVADGSGDGELVDNGRSAAKDRFVYSLGKIVLAGPNIAKSHSISGLPSREFVFGFEITALSRIMLESLSKSRKLFARLDLYDSNGSVVFTFGDLFEGWTWSVPSTGMTAFVYGNGLTNTIFKASEAASYRLEMTIKNTSGSEYEFSAVLLAKSSGWK